MLPRPIPPERRAEPGRAAECRVYDVLADELPDRYTVFAWSEFRSGEPGAPMREHESEFVVVDPLHGLLLIEVKGGTIERDTTTGAWTSVDGSGRRHPIKDPYEQARRTCHGLLNALGERPHWKGKAPPVWYAVLFPDPLDTLPDLGRYDPEILVTAADFGWLERRIEKIFRHWEGEAPLCAPIDRAGLADLESFFAPGFRLRASLALGVAADARALTRLTDEQLHVLELFARCPRVLVTGGPGTGKTVLAFEKATRLARDDGARTLFTCFNRPLAACLADQARDLPGLTVRSFHQLCYEWAHDAGLPVRAPGQAGVPTRYFRHELPEQFLAAIARFPERRFEAVVVDEGQDFDPDERFAIQETLVEPARSTLYVFQDEGQRIYRDSGAWPPDGLTPCALSLNLRNTRAIHDVVQRLHHGPPTRPSDVRGRAPRFHVAASGEEEHRALRTVLHELLHDGRVPASSIAILTSTRSVIGELAPDDRVGPYALTREHDGPPGRVLVDSITRFKGLERDVVILAGLREVEYCDFDALLCVGASRARAHLVVIGPEPVLERFRGAGG